MKPRNKLRAGDTLEDLYGGANLNKIPVTNGVISVDMSLPDIWSLCDVTLGNLHEAERWIP